MGALKAAVQIRGVSPADAKPLKRINKILGKRPPSELKGLDDDMAFFIKNGMERYEKIKADVPKIDPAWTF